jgi:hypothetical protein
MVKVMKFSITLLMACSLLLPSCSSSIPVDTLNEISIQYTPASIPWLAHVYACAGKQAVAAEPLSADHLNPSSMMLAIRLGQPGDLEFPAYQIGTEDLLIVVNPKNPLVSLTGMQVRALFTGQILNWQELGGLNQPVHLWIFSSSDDIWQVFDQNVLTDSPVSSLSRLAASPTELLHEVVADVAAIGLLSRHIKTEEVSEVFTFATVPVLALTSIAPGDDELGLIACLQR